MVTIGLFEILLFLVLPILYIWSIVWGYRDAERRGSNGLLVAIMMAIVWPISPIIWLFIRPD